MFSFQNTKRNKTRRQRYSEKLSSSKKMGLSVVAINFMFDDNLAFLIRSVACFGVDNLYVIGSVPSRSKLNSKSGSLYDYVKIKQFKTPSSFLSFSRENDLNLISLELSEDSKSIYDYDFDFSKNNAIILGHETQGVPNELLFNSQAIHIPMPGVGFCLNVSQAGTAAMSEFCRQRGGMI